MDLVWHLASCQHCDHVNSELFTLQTSRLHATVEHLTNPSDYRKLSFWCPSWRKSITDI